MQTWIEATKKDIVAVSLTEEMTLKSSMEKRDISRTQRVEVKALLFLMLWIFSCEMTEQGHTFVNLVKVQLYMNLFWTYI